MKSKILILSLLFSLLGIGMAEAKRVRVVAHRGYWKCEGSSRNSISALNNALAIGVYGTEFDVHMTADGVPVVHHDATTENGLHIEKITFAGLREKGPRLSNGEEIPTLEAFLKAWNHHKRTKLIFELKPQSTPEFGTRMVEVCLEMVRRHGIKDNEVEYISFSYHICKELMRLHPSATVLPLSTVEAEPEQMSRMHKVMDYYLPTTVKLLTAYKEFDAVSAPGADIISAKGEIEKTIDTINAAFVELLNTLFQNKVFDITTDAQVLQTMLASEGLTKEMAFDKIEG